MRFAEPLLLLSAAIAAGLVIGAVAGPAAGGLTVAGVLLAMRRLIGERAPESPAQRLRRERMAAFRRR